MSVPQLGLSTDELLSTTRAVRRRLDLDRPVPRAVLEECLLLAQQAPSGSWRQGWHFVVVTDEGPRQALAAVWRKGAEEYLDSPAAVGAAATGDAARDLGEQRIRAAVEHLVATIDRVPVLVVPCIEGRIDGATAAAQAGTWGSILPAVWSFMLALRARGLGSAWTTFHLRHEREAAEVLGIPYERVMQAALLPVAYTVGTDFGTGARRPLETMAHWQGWQQDSTGGEQG